MKPRVWSQEVPISVSLSFVSLEGGSLYFLFGVVLNITFLGHERRVFFLVGVMFYREI